MRRSMLLVSAIMACALASANPSQQAAFAAGGHEVKQTTQQSSEYLKETALIPFKLISVPTAFAVGAPISALTHGVNRAANYADAWSAEYQDKGVTPLMLASLPGQGLALAGAVGEGIVRAAINSVDGLDQPFSAKSFSLEELD